MSGIVAVSAVIAMASVLLVSKWDNLVFGWVWVVMAYCQNVSHEVHPKYKTPSYATIVTGFVVSVPALF
jgi:amino acid transporter